MNFEGWTREGYWRSGKLLNGRKVIHENKPLVTVRKPHKGPQQTQETKTASATPEFNAWLESLIAQASLTNIQVLR